MNIVQMRQAIKEYKSTYMEMYKDFRQSVPERSMLSGFLPDQWHTVASAKRTGRIAATRRSILAHDGWRE